ncbi:peptide-methionine (S)-S-oxide reductase MsrA [Leeia sp. TBRC 13508]|uniref:Peptide methionine sulfoxide reductase MsrA n=1 Tax=Leeia speluncae TaxID=2884804 RepID=A0ABS8D8E9_9NEIS|nr:peptide-methionine (S)-S-oxide reductase MsrA [Leeia speluncae]MCB6184490.1 peptide-methionine (S)-S-oxide reductase MsrA [Leeia speluncae]
MNQQIATLAGGCFWCTEAVFARLQGVVTIAPGYMGGHTDSPDYKAVCTGVTGHAEVIQIHYQPEIIDFKALLMVFFATHDPTTLNRQGHDTGTQYRSAIFCHDEDQESTASEVIQQLDNGRYFPNPIVTEVSKASTFYPAESYHFGYFNKNPYQPYCQAVIHPKLHKLEEYFKHLMK